MDSSLMGIPAYAEMTQVSQPSQFSGTIVASSLPKVLAFSQVPAGNIFLYEVTKLVIILCLPPGMELPGDLGVKKGDKPYSTPHGEKTGYVFYKTTQKHMETIDKLFNGDAWRKELSEPLPTPAVPKEPILICKKTITWEMKTFDLVVYEYSDKTLAVFTPVDITKGNDKFLKPHFSLMCPDSPSGKSSGYMCFKNNTTMISFLKLFIPDVPFESMYQKSTPVAATPVKQQREPQLLESKQFMHVGQTFTLEIFEYSEAALALFPSPLFNIDGLQLSSNLTHPLQGTKQGYIVAKSNSSIIGMIKNYFGFTNIESLYTMTQESTRGVAIIPPAGILPPGPDSVINSSFSDMTIKSFDDIPIETLIRVLKTKLVASTNVTNKEILGGKVLIFGENEKVDQMVEMMDDLSIAIEVKCGDKSLVLMENPDA